MRKETEAGIDVSKDVLDVAVRPDERQLETARFDNDAAGHRKVGALAHEGWSDGAGGPRVHALAATAQASAVVCNDIEVTVRHLDRRIELLSEQALMLIANQADL